MELSLRHPNKGNTLSLLWPGSDTSLCCCWLWRRALHSTDLPSLPSVSFPYGCLNTGSEPFRMQRWLQSSVFMNNTQAQHITTWTCHEGLIKYTYYILIKFCNLHHCPPNECLNPLNHIYIFFLKDIWIHLLSGFFSKQKVMCFKNENTFIIIGIHQYSAHKVIVF